MTGSWKSACSAPRRSSRYVDHGFLDCGITGKDWIAENEARRRGHLRPALQQGHLAAHALGAGGAGGFADQVGQGSAGQAHRHRGRRIDQALSRQERREGRGRVLLGRDRGEGAGTGGRHRGHHRDRLVAAREQAAHRGHADGELPAVRQPARPRSPTRGSARRWSASPCCSTARSRRATRSA